MSEWEEFAAYRNMIREAKAEAWEEGYAQGSADSYDSRLDAENPYMEKSSNNTENGIEATGEKQ